MTGWDNFYVIIGSSAAALIGLQFIAIALVADTATPRDRGAIRAFGTPTVVHLGAVLMVSAILSAPWPALLFASIALVICGVGGAMFTLSVARHARRQSAYQPVLEDWLWHWILPFIAYAALTVGAILLRRESVLPAFVVAGAALGIVLIAVHNAWDTVTYIVLTGGKQEPQAPNG